MKQLRRHTRSLLLAAIVASLFFACLYACTHHSAAAVAEAQQRGSRDSSATAQPLRPAYSPDAPLGIRYTQQHPLRVVGDWNRAPLSYVNNNGEPAGIHVDILRRILDKFHIAYDITLMNNAKALDAVQSGEANLVMEFTNAPLREGIYMGNVDVGEYYEVALRLNETPLLRSIHLLNDSNSVGLKSNSYAERIFNEEFDGVLPFNAQTMTLYEGLEGVLNGQIEYFVSGEPQMRNYVRKYGVEEKVSLDIVDMPQAHFRFVSNDTVLLREMDSAYKRMAATGELDDMQKHWSEVKGMRRYTFRMTEISRMLTLVGIVILFAFILFLLRFKAKSENLKEEFLDITHLATDMVSSNLLYYNLTNHSLRNLIGTFLPSQGMSLPDFEQLVHPYDMPRLMEVKDLIKQGSFPDTPVVLHMHRPTDKDAWYLMLLKCKYVTNDSGHQTGLYVSLIDITNEANTAKQIDKELSGYNGIHKLENVGMAYYDSSGHYVDSTLSYRLFFGQRRREEAQQYLRVTTLPRLCDVAYNLDMRTGSDVWVCSHLQIPELALDTWGQVRIRAVKDSEGRKQGYIIIVRDLTEQRRAVSQQRANERDIQRESQLNQRYHTELRTMLWHKQIHILRWEAGNDHIEFNSNTTGTMRTMSLRQYVGLILDDADTTLNEIMAHPEVYFAKPLKVRRHINKAKVVGVLSSTDLTPEVPDVSTYDEVWHPDYADDGTLLGAYGVIIDVTTLVEKEKHLERQRMAAETINTDRSKFLANMTHELRTPLNAVNGFAEMLLLPNTPEERKQYISIMKHNNRLLLSIVDNVLQLSSFDMEGIVVELQYTNFALAFRNALQSLSGYVTKNDISFRYDLPYSELFLNIDAKRILQVLDIFVNNASKYTESGYIRVGYRYDDTQLTVYCTDTGCGIPFEKQKHLFEMFYKVNEYMPGIGLGLTLANRIARAMGATINCYSREGQGTTMSIDVPHNEGNKLENMAQNAAMTAAMRTKHIN